MNYSLSIVQEFTVRIWRAPIQGRLHIFSYTKHLVLSEVEGPWNRIAKFINYCLYMYTYIYNYIYIYIREVCNSPCGSFFCGVTPYGPMGWNRAMQKNDFSSSDFFRTCLGCFQSMKPSLATTLTSCTRGVIVKGQTTGNQENDIVTDLLDAERVRCRDLNLQPSSLKSNTLTIMLQEPCLQGVLLSHSLSLPWLPRDGFSMGSCQKSIFHALKNCLFSALLLRDSEKPGFANHKFSGSKKNRVPLVKF